MSATIIAEALAAAEQGTPAVLHHGRVVVLNQHETVFGVSARLDLTAPQDWRTQFVRADVVEAALAHLAERLERAEARIADLRAVASRMVCDSVQNYGVSDAFCACVTCQVKGYVGKEGEP